MPPHDLIARLHQGRHDVSQSALYRAIQVLHLRGFIEPVLNRTPSQAVTALADRTPIPWNGSDAEVAAWRSAKGLPGPEATVWSLTDRGRDMAVMVKKAKMTKVLPDRSHVGAWLLSICS
jgi:hypothetical protein